MCEFYQFLSKNSRPKNWGFKALGAYILFGGLVLFGAYIIGGPIMLTIFKPPIYWGWAQFYLTP
jgi:hypothetical protein